MSSATMIPVGNLADDEAHRRDRDEHDVHRLAQLLERDLPDRRRLLGGELVRAVARQTGRGLRLGQALVGVGPEGGDDGRLVLREPRLRTFRPARWMPLGHGRGHGPMILRVPISVHHPRSVIHIGDDVPS